MRRNICFPLIHGLLAYSIVYSELIQFSHYILVLIMDLFLN